MLTVDLVMARCKGDRLFVRRLNRQMREHAYTIAEKYIDIAQNHLKQSKEDFEAKCAAIEVHVQHRKLAAGLQKLVLDRCTFEMLSDIDPAMIREIVFQEASRQRQAATLAVDFARGTVLEKAGTQLNLLKDEIDSLLFADLKGAHCLEDFDSIDAEHLVEHYEKSQGQAVLLKATQLSVFIQSEVSVFYRKLFHKLKFLGLMHVIQPLEQGGYNIQIDGPFSMFRSVTKYGLKLALLLPALDECGTWKLDAEVVWGKEKQKLKFHLEGNGNPQSNSIAAAPRLADDVATFVKRFSALETEWAITPSVDILELAGAGLCIPDLSFTNRATGEVAYLEVMGFWSRDAVWKRVELVEAGLPYRIIFAVSNRLRVSEEVLGDELPGSLYVYKGVMNAARIAQMLNE